MYSREVGDQILTFSASGWTYVYTFILYDYETESMWFPVNGGQGSAPGTCGCGLLCITGEYAGTLITTMPSLTTTWQDWHNAFPGSKVMKERE